jgi:hypothetical protein
MKDTTMTAPTPSMILIRLHGPLAAAVAVEWTNAANPASGQAAGPGWEPCHRVGTGLWRLDRLDPEAAARLLMAARLDNVAIRYRLEPAGFWSPASEDRKEISLVGGPVLLAAPALVGSGIVGVPVAVDPGQWSGAPAIALAWCRDGVAIEGATGAEYLPQDADDRTTLTCRVRATNAAASAEAVTAGLAITQAPPQVVGTLFDEVFDEGTGPQAVATADAFAGRALIFAVEGAGAAVDPATGVVTIPTDAPLAGEAVTVSAANSGGTATAGFQVTVEALPEVAPPPEDGTCFLGQDATNRGFHAERGIGAFGGTIGGLTPLYFVSISNGFFLIGFSGGAKVFGSASLTVAIGALAPFTVNWDAGNGRYAALVPGVWEALEPLIGTAIPYSVVENVIVSRRPTPTRPRPALRRRRCARQSPSRAAAPSPSASPCPAVSIGTARGSSTTHPAAAASRSQAGRRTARRAATAPGGTGWSETRNGSTTAGTVGRRTARRATCPSPTVSTAARPGAGT